LGSPVRKGEEDVTSVALTTMRKESLHRIEPPSVCEEGALIGDSER
jgi:hypothetical protein